MSLAAAKKACLKLTVGDRTPGYYMPILVQEVGNVITMVTHKDVTAAA